MRISARSVIVTSSIILAAGCAQRIEAIEVPHPDAATAQSKCGVEATALVSRAQCLCLAKVAGLDAGVKRWQIREYDAYVDVFNTTVTHPIERGISVRIERRGGAVVEIGPWEAVSVDSGPSNSALEPTLPLGGELGRAARLNAKR